MEEWRDPLLGDNELREIGTLIFQKRTARGWTQEDLAGFIGSDYRVVSRHENGHGMNLESLMRYSKAMLLVISFDDNSCSFFINTLNVSWGIGSPSVSVYSLISSTPTLFLFCIKRIQLHRLS